MVVTTQRLTLREFAEDDFAAVHSYAGCQPNVEYVLWGPNTPAQTRQYLAMARAAAQESPVTRYHFAAVLRDTGHVIGACSLARKGDEADLGWIVHRDHWRHGVGTEMARALVDFGFADLALRRITARCDARNTASWRIMDRLGMRREGLFVEARRATRGATATFSDELAYALLSDEWQAGRDVAHYNALPVVFNGFLDLPHTTDGVIELVCVNRTPAIPEKGWVPGYRFAIRRHGYDVGQISLRIGYAGAGPDASSLYFGGQIGYDVAPAHRGNGYAVRACQLVAPLAQAHGMTRLLITNDVTNQASRRVCEKLGARLVRVARLPPWNEQYAKGERFCNIYEWVPNRSAPGPA
jgi:RimJ/RimL family protein N-acetyltransferase